MESITFFSSGEYITFLTNAVIFQASFPMRSHSRSSVQPQSAPQGKGWELIPSHVIPISSTRTHNFQTWVIIAQFQVTKEFAFIGHKWYWNFNPRHFTVLQIPLNPHHFIILSVEVCSYIQVTKGLLLYLSINCLTQPPWKILKLVTKHLKLPIVECQGTRDELNVGTLASGWGGELGPLALWGREREREAQGSKETWACGLRAGMRPCPGDEGPACAGGGGQLQAVTSADVWWRAGYEEGVVISMKFIRSLSWLKTGWPTMAQRSWINERHLPAWFHALQCAPRVLRHSKQGLWSKTSPTSVASWPRSSCWSWPSCWPTY